MNILSSLEMAGGICTSLIEQTCLTYAVENRAVSDCVVSQKQLQHISLTIETALFKILLSRGDFL